MPVTALAVLPFLLQGAEPEDTGFWSFLRPGTVVARCPEGSADHEEARRGWERLGHQIEALTDASDPSSALASMRELLKTPCFHLAVEHGEPPWPRHALALKTWWEGGGDSWLWGYLEPQREGLTTALREVVILPPDARKALFIETAVESPLAPILCSHADPGCGLETGGWVARANTALISRPEPWHHWSRERTAEVDRAAECEREVAGLPAGVAYATWRACVQSRRPRVSALPLGRTRAPTDGWLVLAGRRGHYEFCDDVRAYHLASGAAYVAESCSALALEPDGNVNFEETDDGRVVRVRAGRVGVDNLREASWFLLLRGEVEQVGRFVTYPIPLGMTPRFGLKTAHSVTRWESIPGWSSNQTRLEWAWLRPGGGRWPGGELTWPTSDDRAEAHAASLFDVADKGFVPGCPPALPPSFPRTLAPSVTAVAAPPLPFQRVQEDLRRRLASYRPPPGCAPAE